MVLKLYNYHLLSHPSLSILIMTMWDGEGKSHRAYWSDEENNVHGTLINHGND